MNDLDLRNNNGVIEMYDANEGAWFPLDDPDWGLTATSIRFLSSLGSVEGRNYLDFFPGGVSEVGTPAGTQTPQEAQASGAPPAVLNQGMEAGQLVPEQPQGQPGQLAQPEWWDAYRRFTNNRVGSWEDFVESFWVEESLGTDDDGNLVNIPPHFDDTQFERRAAAARNVAESFGLVVEEAQDESLSWNTRQEGLNFLAREGLANEYRVKLDPKTGSYVLEELPDFDPNRERSFVGEEGAARAQQFIEQSRQQALANGVAPPNLRVQATGIAENGEPIYEIRSFTPPAQEKGPEPLGFFDEMDKRQADAFRAGNMDELFRLEAIRDQVSNDPTILDSGDAASYAARFAESPEEFIALTEAFNDFFVNLSSQGIPPREFVQQQGGPFQALNTIENIQGALAGVQPGGGAQTAAFLQAQPPGIPGGPNVPGGPVGGVPDTGFIDQRAASAAASARVDAEGPFDTLSERDALFNRYFDEELARLEQQRTLFTPPDLPFVNQTFNDQMGGGLAFTNMTTNLATGEATGGNQLGSVSRDARGNTIQVFGATPDSAQAMINSTMPDLDREMQPAEQQKDDPLERFRQIRSGRVNSRNQSRSRGSRVVFR